MANQGNTGSMGGTRKDETQGSRNTDQRNQQNQGNRSDDQQQSGNQGGMRDPNRSNESGNRDRREPGSPDEDRSRRGGDQPDGSR